MLNSIPCVRCTQSIAHRARDEMKLNRGASYSGACAQGAAFIANNLRIVVTEVRTNNRRVSSPPVEHDHNCDFMPFLRVQCVVHDSYPIYLSSFRRIDHGFKKRGIIESSVARLTPVAALVGHLVPRRRPLVRGHKKGMDHSRVID